jgi:membrane protease YdiL (CAAX protease family)
MDGARRANRLVVGGALVSIGVGVALVLFQGIPLGPALWLSLVMIGLPVVAMAQLLVLDEELPPRKAIYSGTLVTLMVLGALSLGVGPWYPGWDRMGLTAASPGPVLVEAGVVTLVALVLVFAGRGVERLLNLRQTDLMRLILPADRGDRAWFVAVSFAAGIGEELAYRGFAMGALIAMGLSPLAALVFTSVSFALLHGYQGVLGALRAGTLGLVLGWSVLRTGLLWPAIAAHAGLDLILGLWLARYLVDPDEGPVSPSPEVE